MLLLPQVLPTLLLICWWKGISWKLRGLFFRLGWIHVTRLARSTFAALGCAAERRENELPVWWKMLSMTLAPVSDWDGNRDIKHWLWQAASWQRRRVTQEKYCWALHSTCNTLWPNCVHRETWSVPDSCTGDSVLFWVVVFSSQS